jgi:uncharacterized repeat protein (TIGR01451 family)
MFTSRRNRQAQSPPPKRRRFRSLVTASATLAAVSFGLAAAPGAMAAPWTCDTTGYITQYDANGGTGGNTLFNRVDRQADGTYALTQLGAYTGRQINALGFRPQDGFMYTLDQNTGSIVRIERDANGAPTFTDLGTPAGMPFVNAVVGTILADGTYFIWGGPTAGGVIVDVSGPTPTVVRTVSSSLDPSVNFSDMAVNPADGKLYAAVNSLPALEPRGVYELVLSNGTLSYGPRVGDGGQAGAQWFSPAGANGTLFAYDNTGTGLYTTDIATGGQTRVGSAPPISNVDGASCGNSIALTKDASPRTVTAGGELTYTYQVTPRGITDNPVSFVDELPAGMTYVPGGVTVDPAFGTPNAYENTNRLEINGTLPRNTTATITARVRLSSEAVCGSSIDNQAQATMSAPNLPSVTVGSDDPTTPANPEDPTTVRAECAADLSIVKSATPTTATPGANQSYKLVVKNNGPSRAVNVRVADSLPAGLTYVSASPECSLAGATVACALPSMAAGEERTFTVTTKVGASVNGRLANTATVGSDTPDPDPSNNTSTVVVPVVDKADLSIVKSATPTTATPGANQSYKLVVKNNGPSRAVNVRVADSLPAGLTYVSASPECSLAGATVACALPSMAAGEERTFTVTTKVGASVNSRLTNTATVGSDTPDPDPSNNTSTVVVPVEGKADLSITKTPSVRTVAPGGQVLYTLVIKNNGPGDATGVTVTDVPPAGLTLQSAKGGTGTTCSVENNRVACRIGTLAAGGTAQVLVTAQAAATASGELTNRVTVTGNEEDPTPGNNTDTSTVTIPPPPGTPQLQPTAELAITKKVNARSIRLGQALTYTVVVTNNGPAAANDVVVTDTLAVPARNVSIKPSAGKCTGTVPFTCRLGTIQPGKTVTITVKLIPTAVGTARNTASVTSPGTDPKTDNNISGVSTTVSKPTLGLTKGANRKTVRAGQTVTYTLRVRNPSSAPVKNVKVCDDLPSGLVYVSSKSRAKLTKGQYCWTVKSLGAGKSKTFTLTARALRGTSGTKTNRATASSPDARTKRASRSVRVTRTALRAGGVTG